MVKDDVSLKAKGNVRIENIDTDVNIEQLILAPTLWMWSGRGAVGRRCAPHSNYPPKSSELS